MDHDIGLGEVTGVVLDNRGEKLPLRGGHSTLDKVIFGIDLVGHDEARVDDHGGFTQHTLNRPQLFDPASGKEKLSSKGPARGVFDVALEEGVGLKEVGVEEGER